MKSVLLVLAMLLSTDWTIVGPLKPHETVSRSVELESGRSTVEVWSSVQGTQVSCHFVGGMLTVEQSHVDRCALSVDVGMTSTIRVQVSNESDRQVDYRIWVHDTK